MSCRHPRSAALSLLVAPPLPVAGIAAPEAGAILHAVRRAFASRPSSAGECDLLLLAALSCAQEASDRLLADLDAAQRAAGFWRARMRDGGHDAFMLLGRGPVHFAAGVLSSLGVGGLAGGGGGDGGGGSKGGRRRQPGEQGEGDQGEQQPLQWSATDRIQERIDALGTLSRRLAAAVAGVHASAHLLRLEAPAGARGTGAAAAAAAAAAPSSTALPPAAPLAASDPDAAERRVALSLRRLRAALEDVPRAAAEAAEPGGGGCAGDFSAPSRAGGGDDREDEPAVAAKAARERGGKGAGAAAGPPLEAARHDLAAVIALLDGCPLCDDGRKHGSSSSSKAAGTPPPQTTPTTTTTAALVAARLPASRDAADALRRAASGALARGALAPVPAWAAMPSRLQRHWLRYAAAGAAAAALAAWARRHSRLAGGSGDLERWAADAGASLASAWRAHVVDPLAAVRRELFATLRDRPAIVSQAEFAGDRDALLRMLRAFEGDHGGGGGQAEEGGGAGAAAGAPAEELAAAPASAPALGGGGAAPAAAPTLFLSPPDADDQGGAAVMSRGMARVMESYERELRRPLRNLFAGSLARCLLIQVQRLKVDTEAAMLEMDQLLRANELSLTLVAAVPSLAAAALAARGAYRLLLVRAPPDPKREAVPCRMAMGALARALGAAGAAARAAEAEREEEEEEEEERRQAGRARAGGAAAAAAPAPALGPSPSPSPRRPPGAPPPLLPAHPLPREDADADAEAGPDADADANADANADADADASNARAVAAAEGAAVHALHTVFQEASRLYLLRRGASGREWPHLREGLVQMARPPVSAEGRLEHHRHLTRTYALFQA